MQLQVDKMLTFAWMLRCMHPLTNGNFRQDGSDISFTAFLFIFRHILKTDLMYTCQMLSQTFILYLL